MHRMPLRRLVGKVAVASLVVAAPVVLTPVSASAAVGPTDLIISEYVEGSSLNKAVEIFNGTGGTVDLGAYTVRVYFNGATSGGTTIPLSGSLADGSTWVVADDGASAAILDVTDQTTTSSLWNGDDAVVLLRGTDVVDSFGRLGEDPGSGWGDDTTNEFTADRTLRRMAAVCTGDTTPDDAFDPATEWTGFPQNTVDGLGSHSVDCGPVADQAPVVSSVSPEDGGTVQPSGTATLTFSEPVALADGAVTLACSTSGDVTVTVTGGPTDYTVDPDADLVDGEDCTLTVVADRVTDVDADDPPDTMDGNVTSTFGVFDACAADFTPTYEIQGDGDSAAVTGQVLTRGVVTADYEGPFPNLRGFYLQDATGDDDPSTSDAIFVFNGNRDEVSAGDVVVVSGDAGDFFDQTQVSASDVVVCGTGASVEPTAVVLPMATADSYERYEGMLVRYEQTLYVTEHFQLGRFGQVAVSGGDRLYQPTNVVAPGPEALALQAENDLNRILVDDTLQVQNPDPIIWGRGGEPLSAENTLRGGDTTTGATGILTWTFSGTGGVNGGGNAWRLRPQTADGAGIVFDATNPRPTSAPEVGGAVQVAGMNLLNFFNTLDDQPDACSGGVDGPDLDCRGAETTEELRRQTAKTVAAIVELDADVIGVNEIENDGYGDESSLATLVDAVNGALETPTYTYVDVDAETGQTDALGDDAIKVGFIYKPSEVTPVGDTAVLDTDEFVNAGDQAPRNRPSLAQAWQSTETGGVFVTDVNHLKSKGSACDEDGGQDDGQGNCSAVRTRAVRTLLEWLAADPTHVDDSDVLLVGDYNSYAEEDPIRALEAGGFTNLVEEYQGEDAYSYVFDGQWGYLDQAMASLSMATQVTGAADYHINADEPGVLDYNTNFTSPGQVTSLYAPDEYRMSDHDPVVVGIDPAPSVYETPYLTGPLETAGRSVRWGSTLPVKAVVELPDGTTPTDVDPVVEVRLRDEVVGTYEMTYVDGYWQHNLRTGDLPLLNATYRVTVIAPANGQSVTTTFTLR